jgi:hypothetical protein
MATRGFTSRRGVRIALGASIGVLLLLGIGSFYLLSAGTHDLSVDDAVQRFRQANPPGPEQSGTPTPGMSASPTPTAGSTMPAASKGGGSSSASTTGSVDIAHPDPASGVYVYDTAGYDETDALTGSRHDYPSQTTYSTERSGCHWVSRWQPVQERWDESEACKTSKGVTLKRYSMYHEFFHRGIREDFLCGSDALVLPWVQTPGDRWTFRCRSTGTTLDMTVNVVGFESLRVGGKTVRAVHIHYEGKVTGDDEGVQIQDRWLESKSGWFLRISSSSQVSTESPFGRVNYRESYRIDLTSLTPRR